MLIALTLPAMSATEIATVADYKIPQELIDQYEQQFKNDQAKTKETVENISKEAENKKEAEVKDVKKETEKEQVKSEVKKEKKVETVSQEVVTKYEQQYEEPQKQQYEQPQIKDEEPSNPDARFPHGLQLGVGVSPTSGLNAFVGYNNKNFNSFWAKRFGIRFDFATYSPIKSSLNKRINKEIGDEGFKIDDSLKIDNFVLNAKHYGAMIDFYPFGNTWFLGGLRISGGYFAGKLDLDADIHGKVNGGRIEFELDGKTYSYDGHTMHGKAKVDWKYSGPYLGTGFDLGLFRGFKFYMDAGVVFTDNTAKFDLDVPYAGLQDEFGIDIDPNSTNPTIQAAYAAFKNAKDAALADARKEAKDYPYYPLVKLGFMYRF